MTQGRIWGLAYVEAWLFSCPLPGLSICVEKLKYKNHPKLPLHPTHCPWLRGQPLPPVLVLSGHAFTMLMGSSWGWHSRGVCSPPHFSVKMLLFDSYLLGGHFLKLTEKSLSYNQHFPEITHKPQAMKRNRFWQSTFNVHDCSKFAELKASHLNFQEECFKIANTWKHGEKSRARLPAGISGALEWQS
jgi:hypothetical protein